MQMYANDNGGYGYVFGSHVGKRREGTWDGETTVSANRIIYPWDPAAQRWFSELYGSFSPGGTPSNRLISGQPQRWLCTRSEPSRAVGIGLMLAGGYLTNKGAQILFCPSNNSARAAKELRTDKYMRYDVDEPFFTSHGKIKRGDNDGIGQRKTSYPIHSCYDGDPANDKSGYTVSLNSGLCEVLTNYSLRLLYEEARWWTDNSGMGRMEQTGVKLEEAGKVGVVSDNLDPWLSMNRYHPTQTCVLPGPPPAGPASSGYPPQQIYYLQAAHWAVTNHDNSYNILFTDGAVKTYSDGGQSVFRSLVDLFAWVWWPGNVANIQSVEARCRVYGNKRKNLDDKVWRPYFDTAYQQD